MKNIYYSVMWWLEELPINIKKFWQRGIRGWSDRDIWAWNAYIADINIQVLERFKNTHTGFPCGLSDRIWKKEIQKMINGFKAYKRFDDWHGKDFIKKNGEFSPNKMKKYFDKNDKIFKMGMESYVKYFYHLWD